MGSAINFAEGLQGKLLVIHGTGDDNVHAQGTEKLVNRLIELGKPFDSMMYPNRSHSISEGTGTTPHIYKLIARYFLQNLAARSALTCSRRRDLSAAEPQVSLQSACLEIDAQAELHLPRRPRRPWACRTSSRAGRP